MKTSLTLTDFAKDIMARAETKVDFVADTRALSYTADDNRLRLGTESFAVNDHCHGQIAEHAKIPALYYKKMREEAPELLGTALRTWFDKYPANRMVRTLGDKARAFVSDKFNRMDDDSFAGIVLPVIHDTPHAEVVSCAITDTKTHIKFKSPKFARQVKVGDDVQFGIAFSNSEVGAGRLTGSLFCYRLICLNGMVIEDEQFASTHVGKKHTTRDLGEIFKLDTIKADGEATILKLRDFARELLTDRFVDQQVERMRGLTEVKIGDPVKAVEKLAKQHSFTEGERTSVLKHLIEGHSLTMWGLTNAVTRAAEDCEDYNRASTFETIGGRMLTLPKTQYTELLAA